jgi:hypothetical protein
MHHSFPGLRRWPRRDVMLGGNSEDPAGLAARAVVQSPSPFRGAVRTYPRTEYVRATTPILAWSRTRT